MSFDIGGKSDKGRVRAINQDNLLVATYPLADGSEMACLLVADGMGGHSRGEVASYESVATIQHGVRRLAECGGEPSEDWCRSLIEGAHAKCRSALEENEISGTTVTLALAHRNSCYIGHVGDSRAYLMRGGEASQLTHDHTWDGEAKRRGLPAMGGGALLQAVGVGEQLEVETQTVPLRGNDKLLLCSDGLYKMLDEERISQILAHTSSTDETIDELIAQASANGGTDNITVCLLRSEAGRTSISMRSAALVMGLTLTLAGIAFAAKLAMAPTRSGESPVTAPDPAALRRPSARKAVVPTVLLQGQNLLVEIRNIEGELVPFSSLPDVRQADGRPVERLAQLRKAKRTSDTRISLSWEGNNLRVHVRGRSAKVQWDSQEIRSGTSRGQAIERSTHRLSWIGPTGGPMGAIVVALKASKVKR